MRRQLVMMTLAITSIVVIAFVLPLAFMVRTISADRATSQATADAQNVAQIIAGNRGRGGPGCADADFGRGDDLGFLRGRHRCR